MRPHNWGMLCAGQNNAPSFRGARRCIVKRFWVLLVVVIAMAILLPYGGSDALAQAVSSENQTSWGKVKSLFRAGDDQLVLGKSDYIWYPINPWSPLGGYAFGRYVSGRGYHLGDDCVRGSGTPVYAIWHGRVKYARYNSGGWGYLMIVEYYINNIPFCVVYGHLGATMYPGEGNWVSRGQYIGTVGSTAESGQATPHLHLGIHYGGYDAQTGTYPSWCKGYASSTSGWFNPTTFIAYW